MQERRIPYRSTRARLAGASSMAVLAALAMAPSAYAQEATAKFDVPEQPLSQALLILGGQAHISVAAPRDLVEGRVGRPVQGDLTARAALDRLLDGSGLKAEFVAVNAARIVAPDPQAVSAGGGAETNVVQELVVTAQKKSENIQVVPIAISAFTQQDLTTRQVAGGPDLMTQVPNMTFTKTNFSSYSIQIRGIGTQAISATTDPAVAVAFNNTPFIRNRFFEQEFYDLERIEVLRGPQGTLYGRNATGGVVNILSAKPTFQYEAKVSADVGNFASKRVEGMINMPLVEDKVALRVAGAWTKRDGYDTNQLTGSQIDGRDLWSTRTSLRVEPSDKISATLIWEHFQENDDRLRSGKQLCDKDVVTQVGGIPVGYYQTLPEYGQSVLWSGAQASFSQGCKPESLYSPDSFQTPNGLMLPYYVPLGGIGLPIPGGGLGTPDPYVSTTQSRNLRVIESTVDPDYRAKSDLGELQIRFDLGRGLTLQSETGYNADMVYSLEDFNRFNTATGAWREPSPDDNREGVLLQGPNGGIFCDPQLGCSDRLVAVDISSAKSRQFSQEFRLSSDYAGPFNFSLGANFLRYDTEDKYYVFINSISLIAASGPPNNDYAPYVAGKTDNVDCMLNGYLQGDPNGVYPVQHCTYIDPNPIGSVNDQGHNYFLSRNPYKLISYAAFGEVYYQITDNLKLTGGLRWTIDKKNAPRIPTWILASSSVGYPVAEVVKQEWSEPTGRLAIDWKPNLGFTDQTLLYASYAHGYKAGGANPPGFVREFFANPEVANGSSAISATRPKTFDAEFVDAFELGSKNTFADGKATLNLAAFYYDYKGYQVSEIVDRSAFNRNFDATVWGLEIESDWRPLKNLRLGLKGGYEKTRIADGMQAVDLMDRTAGHTDWVVHRPFPTYASSCILPTFLFVGHGYGGTGSNQVVNVGGVGGGNPGGCEIAYIIGNDPVTNKPYVPNPVPDPNVTQSFDFYDNYPGFDPKTAPNNGEGFYKQLGGNELPNAPHWTATFTGDYTIPLPHSWLATLHSDVHWQSQSWWRVFNDKTFDKLHPYFTMNLAAIFTNEEAGWNIMAYVKNVTNETAITGAFLNSDDTGLTTNVFLTEPRLYGLRVTKTFTDVPLLRPLDQGRDPNTPALVTLEIGGQLQRHHAPNQLLEPSFADAFAPPLDIFGDPQNDALDWGDGREVKLTWRPGGDAWTLSAGVRFGKANGVANASAQKNIDPVCAFGGFLASFCTTYADDPKYGPYTRFTIPNHAEVMVTDREEHRLVDLFVGRDMGFGHLSKSTVGLGLRYAQLKSTTAAQFRGVPDWNVPEGFLGIPSHDSTHTAYDGAIDARRDFDGAGPAVSWEASYPILEGNQAGRVDIDWSASGGVLFGTQKTSISGAEKKSSFVTEGLRMLGAGDPAPPTIENTTLNVPSRSNSVTVPNLSLSAGLSYKIDRMMIGAGYRWERYFNAIDGGFTEKTSDDRSIDGPYLKVSVGFGG